MSPDGPRWRRYLRLVRPNVAADVDEELRLHLDLRIARNIALGMSEDEARRDALRRFGDVDLVRGALVHHDTRREQAAGRRELLADLAHDVRFGWRGLRRSPAFAIAAIVTIGIGIGANAAIFSVLNAVVLRPLPYRAAQELVHLSGGIGSGGEFLALRERLRSVSGLGLYAMQTHPIDDGRETQRLEGAAVTPGLIHMLGVAPLLGRDFTPDEGRYGNHTVLLISYGLWQRRFGGSPDIVGRRVFVEGVPHTIVGVMPANFHFPGKASQYWQPYAFNPANSGYHWAVGDKVFVGRLAPGASMQQAERELREVWPSLANLNPLWNPGPDYAREARVASLQDRIVGSTSTLLWMLAAGVLLVLLIGCVNVANLLLARATARERELTVRAALGGGRGRLVRQMVTESLLLAGLGGALGLVLASVAVRMLVSALPPDVPRVGEIAVDGSVVAFATAAAMITGVLFGIVPALRATRFGWRGGGGAAGIPVFGRATTGVAHQRVSALLVVAEMALAVVLVVSATLLVRSFDAMRRVETGFQASRVIAARVTPPAGTYNEPARATAMYSDMLQRLDALPGVRSVAAVDKLPLAQQIWGVAARVEGQFEDGTRPLPSIDHWQMVTPRYFETMGIPVRGRAFTDADRDGAPPVAIVSESVARRFWPNGDAIGQRIGYPFPSPWITIVGVVPDTKQDSLREATSMSMYVPWLQRTRMSGIEMWLLARTGDDPATLAASIRRVVTEVDRAVAVSDVRTMESVVSGSLRKERFTTLLVGAFAATAMLLGAIGIYGVMSYIVGQRTREMGVRLALGAPVSDVLGLVVARAAKLASIGALVGLAAAFFATRSLRALLYGVSATDPLTFVGVPLLFVLVAVGASYAPALRATRVDPVRALRSD